jgi:hypothetical protein
LCQDVWFSGCEPICKLKGGLKTNDYEVLIPPHKEYRDSKLDFGDWSKVGGAEVGLVYVCFGGI